jgi:uncharacterized protein involved in exopolysaccharide biosynthesis
MDGSGGFAFAAGAPSGVLAGAEGSARAYWTGRALRRLPLALAVAGLIAALGVLVALRLPSVYAARTQLTVAAPQIADGKQVAVAPVPALKQLQLYRERLLTRANLLAVARKLQVFAHQDQMTGDEIVRAMRKATRVTTVSGRDQATLMTIGFRARTPELAAGVVNAYLTLILHDDVHLRTAGAQDAVDFFGQEVSRASSALDQQAEKVLAFKKAHGDALPENAARMQSDALSLRGRLEQAGRQLVSLARERDWLMQAYVSADQKDFGLKTEAQKRLDAAEADLDQAQAIYSARNPRVRMLKAKIAALKRTAAVQVRAQDAAQAGAEGTAGPAGAPKTRAMALLKMRIADLKAQIATLVAQRKEVQSQLAALDRALAAVPANALALSALERDRSVLQARYQTAVESLDKARQAERIAALSRGERVAVIAQPAVPTDPVAPRRGLIAGGGAGGGLVLGLLLALALELTDRRVRRGQDLVRHLGITPLAVLPYAPLRRERIARQSRRVLAVLALAVAIGLGLLAVGSAGGLAHLSAEALLARLGPAAG